MKIHMEYADCTVTEEHDEIQIFGNDNVNPIVIIKNGEIFVYGMDEHYNKSPSKDFKHLKVFLLDAWYNEYNSTCSTHWGTWIDREVYVLWHTGVLPDW